MNKPETITIKTDNISTKIQSFDPYPLVPENHPILSKVMPEFDFAKYDLLETREEFITRLSVTMKRFGGMGLAAPQVGFETRVFVIGFENITIGVFNPRVLEVSPEMYRDKEGCLTFPALYVTIPRPTWITAEFQNVHGDVIQQRYEGLTARCFMHELDHLNGKTFTELVGPVAMKMARKKQEKLIKKYVRYHKKAK